MYSSVMDFFSRARHWKLSSKGSYSVLSPTGRLPFSPKRAYLIVLAACATLFVLLHLRSLASHVLPKVAPQIFPRPEYLAVQDGTTTTTDERYAYVTWLSNTVAANSRASENFDDDLYFTATRVLVWQLLHDPKTKTSGIDVIVMVSPGVSEAHRERLRKDGAIVRAIENVHGQNDAWIVPKESRWDEIMSKLRAWEMVEYSRVLMLDGDTLLQSSLDDVFQDPGAQVMKTKPNFGQMSDEPELPEEYLLSSYQEMASTRHTWPPGDFDDCNHGYFNGGFFMLKPDKKMFDYYVGLLDIPYRFSPKYMEQNLLNYAHRWDGPMPWREVANTWNTKYTSDTDLAGGVVSMHEKFWKQRSGGNKLREFLLSKRQQMIGYYQAYDELED
ncbi:nucleotide-diphospho-sugar transferase [Stachybotrys elegans]|uniref:Nucleotide-diphospho-sugar transferase n=1 Tax=Stachybotrys elegans TaxID=80388 RepID=A0A8K0SBA4_9HYPO|nr:nucleotide-diphospho-sugar transferase [Stachybotrys elegans]